MATSPLAGKPADPSLLVNVPRLVTAYYTGEPDPSVPAQRVSFGTSGHRGSSFDLAFNEAHILAITEAICRHRAREGIDGPLFIGIDTHALSEPAFASALEVLAAHGVEVMVADGAGGYTPTPVISHAILTYNRGRTRGSRRRHRDHAVAQPATRRRLQVQPAGGRPGRHEGHRLDPGAGERAPRREAARRPAHPVRARAQGRDDAHRTTTSHNYVDDLASVVDLDVVRGATIRLGVDPLGGASVAYWDVIAERYGLRLEVVNRAVDPTFRFMTVDWDGKIRMDPSSP